MRCVFPRPELLYMNSGLYTLPGASATARAAATARRLAEPTTKLSKRSLESSCMTASLPRRPVARQALQHELGDRLECLEHARTMQRVRREFGDAAEVERIRELVRAEYELARQVLLVVL